MKSTGIEEHIISEEHGNALMHAMSTLVGTVKMAEAVEGQRSSVTKLTIEVFHEGGGVEEWTITVERTGSSH